MDAKPRAELTQMGRSRDADALAYVIEVLEDEWADASREASFWARGEGPECARAADQWERRAALLGEISSCLRGEDSA